MRYYLKQGVVAGSKGFDRQPVVVVGKITPGNRSNHLEMEAGQF